MADIHPIHVTLTWENYQALIRQHIQADEIAQYALVEMLKSHGGSYRIHAPNISDVDAFEVEYIEDNGAIEFILREREQVST